WIESREDKFLLPRRSTETCSHRESSLAALSGRERTPRLHRGSRYSKSFRQYHCLQPKRDQPLGRQDINLGFPPAFDISLKSSASTPMSRMYCVISRRKRLVHCRYPNPLVRNRIGGHRISNADRQI